MAGAKYGRYRNTALVSYDIGDALEGLQYSGYIAPDIDCAARIAPLRFNPQVEPMLFQRNNWWKTTHEQSYEVGTQVARRFNVWYHGQAKPIHKAYLSLVSLMTGWQFIEETIQFAHKLLGEKHRMTIVDADDTISTITDRAAMADPKNVAAILDEPRFLAMIEATKGMVNRIQNAPGMPLARLDEWHKHSAAWQTRIHQQHLGNMFLRAGVKPGRAAKVIAKSYELLQTFFGRDAARQFRYGEQLLIEAKHFVWGLRILKSASLISHTINPSSVHTPFEIILYSHDGDRLCNGCVLWPDTPVFDQAVGFRLATADPEEELQVLADMNVSNVTTAGREHPALQFKFRPGDSWLDERERAPACEGIADFLHRPGERWEIWDRDGEQLVEVVERAVAEIDRHVINLNDIIPEGAVEIVEPDEFVMDITTIPTLSSLDSDDIEDYVYRYEPPVDLSTEGDYSRRINELRRQTRAEYYQEEVVQRIQEELFRRIDAPAGVLECIMNPDDHYWARKNITKDAIPCRVARYVTDKRFDD